MRCKPRDRFLGQLGNVETLHMRLAERFHPDFARSVGADFDDVNIF